MTLAGAFGAWYWTRFAVKHSTFTNQPAKRVSLTCNLRGSLKHKTDQLAHTLRILIFKIIKYFKKSEQNADKSRKNKLPFFTVLGSLGRTLLYHTGTLAFGSLLIAIVKIIRTIIEYFSNKFKSETDKSKLAKFIVA